MTTPHPTRSTHPTPTIPQAPEPPPATTSLSRSQRLLAATAVTGALALAGIGFTGSYAAVRNLATRKGFGTFAYLFPLGIDTGICITLALDLLLTWIRIPFPLLRPTAWLLTAATIAFNAAAAWPDPVGTGMHAVIPILFITCVEAARHAIGRIADITADTHGQGIRPTRWLLSPVPTFLLWRRMKLWELRSYHQAIQTEQERLLYQARLRTHYGRTWRRTAPATSLTPLKLARYGIPLSHTVPAGLTAAGLEPTLVPPAHETHTTTSHSAPTRAAHAPNRAANTPRTDRDQTPAATADPSTNTSAPNTPQPKPLTPPDRLPHALQQPPNQRPAVGLQHDQQLAHHDHPAQRDKQPPPQQSNFSRLPDLAHTISSPTGAAPANRRRPGPAEDTPPHVTQDKPNHYAAGKASHSSHQATAPTAAGSPQPTRHAHPRPSLPDTPHTPAKRPPRQARQTTVDRYYQGWHDFLQQNSREPTAAELATHLTHQKTLGRNGRPPKPKTLARYLLNFRIYTVWATHRAHATAPDPRLVLQDLADHGITSQYNRPIEATDLNRHQHDYERRWHALNDS
ncbi:DUF2637 domain-containing protein [Streptomyces sp. NPDC086766]|uniref:DUF2637 domain-containing protein n=1 Tax=Streptomyces sp. NPDC086766 TaxID=3365754 RepID=UPI00381FB60E